jgi:hypothetical protein
MTSSNRSSLFLVILALAWFGGARAEEGSAPVEPAPEQPAAGARAGETPTPEAPAAEAPDPDGMDPLVRRLVGQGLENVQVVRRGSEVRVSYENRRYRWQVAGLGVALAAAAKEAPEGATLVVTPKMWGVPEFQVEVPADDYRRFLEGSLSEAELRRHFRARYGRGGAPRGGDNRSFGRMDVTAGLGFRASFTTEDPDEGFNGRFLAGLEGALLPGLGYTAQETFSNENERAKMTQARVGGVLHPTSSLFLAVSGGRLAEDMDAVQGELGWFASNGRRSARLTVASGRDRFFVQNAQSGLLTLTQWIGRRDLALSVVGGRFWEGDRGFEVLLQSGFRERRFLVGGGRSGGVTRTRVQFILPLGPRVQPEPRTLRFKIRDTFNARYRAPKGLVTEARVGGVVPPSLLEERQMLFSPEITRTYLKELRRSADLLQ